MINKGIARKTGLDKIINYLFEPKTRRERKALRHLKNQTIRVSNRNRKKVFVIGFNKTGTTSIEHALKELGYILGDQGTAEQLLDDIIEKNYKSLFSYLKTAEAFQDIPFSLPGIYKKVIEQYPDALFILSVRDTPEQWYSSLVQFHSKVFGNGTIPTKEVLQEKHYHYEGYPYKYINFTFNGVIYEEEHYKNVYLHHIRDVEQFFADKQNQLCIVNVANGDDYLKMCEFLGYTPKRDSFEWKNKTQNT